ncbi:MAG: hypothetical protein CVU05_00075 [Bacteroidetes bacterium HGW-Bacteroidetes-21]|jgi:photosystem II stability/assembly factor-like uncharacterized protein|nr:MAG: hypothetical protein CVU05_00075 [Bacteroidetes bacterium HGW-Bacteroidetes-21]
MIKCFKILIIAFAIHCSLSVNAQWDIVFYDTINNASFQDIQFINTNTGYAVANIIDGKGYLIKTLNGGTTWDTAWFPYKINSVYFINENVGYICGWHSYVYKTINGGDSWSLCDTTHFDNEFLNFDVLWFRDENYGVVAKLNSVYITTNGGSTFYKDTVLFGTTNQIISNTDGIWSRTSKIIKYSEYYDSLFIVTDTLCCDYGINGMNFIDKHNGYAVGMGWYGSQVFNYGVIIKTIDGGYNWVKKDIPEVYILYDVDFLNENIGYAVGQGYEIQHRFLKTEDNGETWGYQNAEFLPSTYLVKKIDCLNDTICYAAGYMSVYKTTNGGGPLISMDAAQIELNKKQINIYPNPAQTTLIISFPESYAIRNATTYKIVDKLGREVKSGKMETSSFSLSVEDLPVGLYVIIVQGDSFIEQKKFVKE